LDFFIPEVMICIEIDGEGHVLREEQDERRDRALSEAGITTIRVSAAAVFRDPHEVAHSISMSIKERLGER